MKKLTNWLKPEFFTGLPSPPPLVGLITAPDGRSSKKAGDDVIDNIAGFIWHFREER